MKVGKKDRKKFAALITDYLQNRRNLQCTFILLDARLTPQEIDLEFVRWMVESGLPLALVFTKTDKVSKKAAQANIDAFSRRHEGNRRRSSDRGSDLCEGWRGPRRDARV